MYKKKIKRCHSLKLYLLMYTKKLFAEWRLLAVADLIMGMVLKAYCYVHVHLWCFFMTFFIVLRSRILRSWRILLHELSSLRAPVTGGSQCLSVVSKTHFYNVARENPCSNTCSLLKMSYQAFHLPCVIWYENIIPRPLMLFVFEIWNYFDTFSIFDSYLKHSDLFQVK